MPRMGVARFLFTCPLLRCRRSREAHLMRRYRLRLLCVVFLPPIPSIFVHAQQSSTSAPQRVAILAGRLNDCKSDAPISHALILIEGDKILSVTPGGSAPAGVELIDLSKATVLPGFVDAHTHVLLQGDIT